MGYEPNNITDCLICAKLEIEKSRLLMDLLIQDYPFDAEPDKTALIWAYKQMAVFMDYVHGSIFEAAEFLEQAIALDTGVDTNG